MRDSLISDIKLELERSRTPTLVPFPSSDEEAHQNAIARAKAQAYRQGLKKALDIIQQEIN